MAPQIDASTPGRAGPTATASLASASFNPPGNTIILAAITVDTSGTTSTTIGVSNNGTNLTWVQINKHDGAESGNPGTVANWYAVVPAGGRTGLVVTATSSITGRSMTMRPYVVNTVDLVDVLGALQEGTQVNNTLNTPNLTLESANSLIFWTANESNTGGGNPTSSNATISAYNVAAGYSGASGYRTGGAAGTTTTFNLDGAGTVSLSWNYVGVEINESGVVQTGNVSLTATPTLTVTGGTVIRVQQATVALSASATLTARLGQSGNVSITSSQTITVNGQVSLQQVATLLLVTTALTVGQAIQTHAVSVYLVASATTDIVGSRSRSAVIETRYERPPIEHPFRVIVQEILTGEIVELDLPVSNEFTYTKQLTGPTIMEGDFKPEIISVQELGLDGFAYWFHVEIDEEIRASAIFLPPRYEDSALNFSAEGIAAIPHFTTWTSSFSAVGVDPFVVVRNIWNHVQSDPRSNYGVVVSTNLSGQKLGTPASSEDQNGRTNAARAIANRIESGDPIAEDWTWAESPPEVGQWNDFLLAEFKKTTGIVAFDWLEAYAQSNPVKDAEPYELQWWEAPNCGDQIDTLASQVPFDYKERVSWNADKTDVLHYIDLAYPRMGSPKPDLVFNEENILEVVPIQEPEDTYASEVIVIGAGEGSSTIRGYAAENFANRVKKSYVVTDKSITTKSRADAVAISELGLRRGRLFEIAEIVIRAQHTNANIGEYDVGDDIYVEVDIPWLLTTYGSWYRIVSITHQPSVDILRLGLERSDSFRYPTTT